MAGPIKRALLAKSREAALTAVQTYNNPLIKFKSETFIVLMTIAWTYLLHAYYARAVVDYRHRDKGSGTRRTYARTPEGGFKYWELSQCLKSVDCPLDRGTANNLMFLIGLRHEIEHHRPPHLDDHMSGRYLACALNYESWLTTLFGERYSLGDTVAMALQFRELRATDNPDVVKLPSTVSKYIEKFEGNMTQEEYDDPRFAFRLVFTRRVVGKKGQADRAIEFVKLGDEGAEGIQPEKWLIKEQEPTKFRAKMVIHMVEQAGCTLGKYEHTLLWRKLDGKNPANHLGVWVAGEWFWYQSWVDECKAYCTARDEGRVPRVR
jgi:hypothetical protein